MGLFTKTSGQGWSFDKGSGCLTINGNLGENLWPFKQIAKKVRTVVARKGACVRYGNGLFRDMTNLVAVELSDLDVSECSDMAFMFSGCSSLISADLSGWNTADVRKINDMFSECSSLRTVKLNGWDTGNVINMVYLFSNCRDLNSLEMTGWQLRREAQCLFMFYGVPNTLNLTSDQAIQQLFADKEDNAARENKKAEIKKLHAQMAELEKKENDAMAYLNFKHVDDAKLGMFEKKALAVAEETAAEPEPITPQKPEPQAEPAVQDTPTAAEETAAAEKPEPITPQKPESQAEPAVQDTPTTAEKPEPSAEELIRQGDAEWDKDNTDFAKVLQLYQLAAEKGNYTRVYRIGRMYRYGWGTEQSYEKSVAWMKLGSEHGDMAAMNVLSIYYMDGLGVPRDYPKALELIRYCADKDNMHAVNNLGYLYENGYGVDQDYAKALELYKKAANGGIGSSMYHIGMMYMEGRGVRENLDEAKKWLEAARQAGHSKAAEKIRELQDKISRKEAEAMQKEEKPVYSDSIGPKGYLKRNINVGVIGPAYSGKTMLTQAIKAVLREQTGDGDIRTERSEYVSYSEYETEDLHYTHIDTPGSIQYYRSTYSAMAMMDVAVLVHSAVPDDPEDWISSDRFILAAREQGVPSLIVFLNKCDLIDDAELLELHEQMLQSRLIEYGYPEETPIIFGSAKAALDEPDGVFANGILRLLGYIAYEAENTITETDRPVFMTIENVYSTPTGKTIAGGRMERGTLLQGDELEIIGNSNDTLRAAAMQLQLFGRNVESILTGDVAGVLLNGISRDDIHRGMVLAKPGTVRAYTRFEAYMDFGQMRRSSILFSGREAEFFFRTANVRGRIITRNDDKPSITHGEHRTVIIELHKPVAVAEGLRFIMMDKVWIIATGRITRILE